jgi:1-phosphatidylinositol-4-phosphate 5-kinase
VKPRGSAERLAEEDASWWTEEIHKRREIRRRWKEVEDENTVVIGNKVDTNHPNYVTAYNMLTGLRVAVPLLSVILTLGVSSECKSQSRINRRRLQVSTKVYIRQVLPSSQVSNVYSQGNELSPASKHDFKFKDYAPWVFRHLRALFHLDAADYLISLTSHILLSELGSPGKSGSFFYFSRDYRFVIKTLHPAEHRYLRKILRQYYEVCPAIQKLITACQVKSKYFDITVLRVT